jgi:hypothetical protein
LIVSTGSSWTQKVFVEPEKRSYTQWQSLPPVMSGRMESRLRSVCSIRPSDGSFIMSLQQEEDLLTESVGEGRERRLQVRLK